MAKVGPGTLTALRTKLVEEIYKNDHRMSLSFCDLSSGCEIEFNGEKPLYPASMIKTLLLLTALEKIESGSMSLEDIYFLKEKDKSAGGTPVKGSGILQFAEVGTVYTVKELLRLMISISDNVATNILYEIVGRTYLEAVALMLKLEQTVFFRKMYDLSSPLPSNVSSARDLTRMLVTLEKGNIIGPELKKIAVEMMLDTVNKERIGRYISKKATVANKVGTVSGIFGDMALIYLPQHPPLALTIIVRNPQDSEEAARFIGKLAELTVGCFI